MVKRHTRPNPQKHIQGGIVEREARFTCNVMLTIPAAEPTRVGSKQLATATRVRVARKTGEDQ